jgi:hypothetical protein
MRSFESLIRSIVLAAVCVPQAFACGPQGHRTVGAIADRLLTPASRAEVVPARTVVLDEDYQREAESIVRERLLLAGGRLANLLNETLVTH